MERAFSGFAALPPPMTGGRAWYDVLEVGPDADTDAIRTALKRQARKHHPDAGGTDAAMATVNEAYRQAMENRAAS